MGFFDRFFGRRRLPELTPSDPPLARLGPDEAWLDALAVRIGLGTGGPPVTPELWKRIDSLVAQGRTLAAAEWLEKILAAIPPGSDRDALRARAAELRLERGDVAAAARHLDALTGAAPHAARAHFLLGELLRADGDLRGALHHLEAALSIDVDTPNARVLADAVREQLHELQGAQPVLEPTLVGPEAGAGGGGRYTLVKELGRGASGVVYLARDAELERDVAVKLLHPHIVGPGVAAFFAEARLAASLRHPHIVGVLDLDEAHRRLVLEYADGGTLKARLAKGPLELADALARHVEIVAALAAAHRRGVVHRDVKPANLLFRRDQLVLGDFGVANLVTTESGGTPMYMAPEQLHGRADASADVFAAAVILVEALTGHAPWDARDAMRPDRPAPSLPPPAGPLGEPVRAYVERIGALDPAARPSAAEALTLARGLADRARAHR
jgi:tetratricopeptide (TPR) repeat protein